jgi:hypothetical protein
LDVKSNGVKRGLETTHVDGVGNRRKSENERGKRRLRLKEGDDVQKSSSGGMDRDAEGVPAAEVKDGRNWTQGDLRILVRFNFFFLGLIAVRRQGPRGCQIMMNGTRHIRVNVSNQ